MSGDDEIVRDSNPNATGPERAAGDMGVSSERDGPTGPGQHATDGTRPTAPRDADDPTRRPSSSPATPRRTRGIEPKAGYSSKDPRSADSRDTGPRTDRSGLPERFCSFTQAARQRGKSRWVRSATAATQDRLRTQLEVGT